MRRSAVAVSVAILSCAVFVTCAFICYAQEKATGVSAEEKLPEEVAKYYQAMQNNNDKRPILIPWEMEPGNIGHMALEHGQLSAVAFAWVRRGYANKHGPIQMKIIQVFEKGILVSFEWRDPLKDFMNSFPDSLPGGSRFRPGITQREMFGEERVIVPVLERRGTFFVQGIDMKGIVSDSRWTPSPKDVFEVVGTRTYETLAGGSKTVFVLSKVRSDRIEAYLQIRERKQAEAAPREREALEALHKEIKERKAATEKAKWRVWTDSAGKFKVEARFSGIVGGNVLLKNRDEESIVVPLEKLSPDDQEWVKRWRESRSKPLRR